MQTPNLESQWLEDYRKKIPINVGAYQGLVLSPLLLILVIDGTTTESRGDEIWEQVYADKFVQTAETKDEAE